MTTDWKLIKNDYEIMHSSVKELATSHHTSESLIEHAVKEENWERKNADDVQVDELSERLATMDIAHQMSLVPKFISLQAKMLDKCDTLLDSVETIEHASDLKIVSEVIEKHRPSIMGVKKEGNVDNVLKISIANKVGNCADGETVSVSAIEITESAGATNGLGAMKRLN